MERRLDFRPDTVLALDIETVPDRRLIPADWPDDKFPKLPWHKVVAISFVEAEIERSGERERYAVTACRSGGDESYDEERLLRSFWKYFEARRPRVVTWNGRGFDLPVLRMRAMMLGISTAVWSRSGDRWQGYNHRYSPGWHTDVMDQFSDYGAAPRMGLEDAAIALGFPGKIGGSGSGVAEMMAQGRLADVRAYCEADALLTFGVYAHWCHASGLAGEEDHAATLDGLARYLEEGRAQRPHLGAFLDGWRTPRGRALPRIPPPRPPPRRPALAGVALQRAAR